MRIDAREALDRAIAAAERADEASRKDQAIYAGGHAQVAQAWAAIADQLALQGTDGRFAMPYDEGEDWPAGSKRLRQAIDDIEGGDGGDSLLLCQACEHGYSQASVLQDDLAQALRLLGLGDHARPKSPHEVFQDEVLPAIRRLARDGGDQ